MKSYRVSLSPLAAADLDEIVDWIADQSSVRTARGFVGRIERRLSALRRFSARGTRRDDLAPGLRIVGLEKRVTIVFRVEADVVRIERVLYGGRDLNAAFPAAVD